MAGKNLVDRLEKCKDITSLKKMVTFQLSNRLLDPQKCWTVIAIDQSNQDAEFSAWLVEAIKLHRVLKRRSSFNLRKTSGESSMSFLNR